MKSSYTLSTHLSSVVLTLSSSPPYPPAVFFHSELNVDAVFIGKCKMGASVFERFMISQTSLVNNSACV